MKSVRNIGIFHSPCRGGSSPTPAERWWRKGCLQPWALDKPWQYRLQCCNSGTPLCFMSKAVWKLVWKRQQQQQQQNNKQQSQPVRSGCEIGILKEACQAGNTACPALDLAAATICRVPTYQFSKGAAGRSCHPWLYPPWIAGFRGR